MHEIFGLDNIIIHVLPGAAAGIAAFAGVKAAIADHTRRISRLERISSWNSRKITQVATIHNQLHPQSDLEVNDYPDNGL